VTPATLENKKIRTYLRELDDELAILPAKRARELREQVTAHLDEALSPDADDEAVEEVLAHLGTAREVVAEATRAEPIPVRRKLRARVRRFRWWTWAAIGVVVLLLGAGGVVIGFAVSMASAPSLTFTGGVFSTYGWWSAQDEQAATTTSADGLQQTTVPTRPGKQQGFYVTIYNPSGWSQTVLGVPSTWDGGPSGNAMYVAVSTTSFDWDNETNHVLQRNFAQNLEYTIDGVVPPHRYAVLRVLWTSTPCFIQTGGSGVVTQITLEVRVGWGDRTESFLNLPVGFALSTSGVKGCQGQSFQIPSGVVP
jgi:hypothetical protein